MVSWGGRPLGSGWVWEVGLYVKWVGMGCGEWVGMGSRWVWEVDIEGTYEPHHHIVLFLNQSRKLKDYVKDRRSALVEFFPGLPHAKIGWIVPGLLRVHRVEVMVQM